MASAKYDQRDQDGKPHTASQQQAQQPADDTAVSAHDDYTQHPLLLTFKDAVIEAEYVHFVYSEGGGVGGKLYAILAFVVLGGIGILYQREGELPTARRVFDSPEWLTYWALGVVPPIFLAAAMFVERLHRYREYILMAVISTHWPAFQYINLTVKHPSRYGYIYTTACYFFCAFISQPRISCMAVFLSVTPLATYVLVSSLTDYWQDHTPFEVVLWPLMFFPLALLHSFEKVSRRNFEQRRRCNRVVERLQDQTAVTQSLVANFFAPTPTYLMLNSRTRVNSDSLAASGSLQLSMAAAAAAKYACGRGEKGKTFEFADGVAFVVTDLAGFTKWSSSQKPRAVINMVRGMFGQIDGVLGAFGVEKVATVGDAFIGASFPPVMPPALGVEDRDTGGGDGSAVPEESPQALTARLVLALRFSLAILEFASNGLKMRVGLHVGGAVCGCFGTTPPKIDLLGDDFELAQLLEQTGTPGQVHASRAVLQAVKGQGVVIGASETEHGACFTGWDPADDHVASTVHHLSDLHGQPPQQERSLHFDDDDDDDGGFGFTALGRLKNAIQEDAIEVCALLASIADDVEAPAASSTGARCARHVEGSASNGHGSERQVVNGVSAAELAAIHGNDGDVFSDYDDEDEVRDAEPDNQEMTVLMTMDDAETQPQQFGADADDDADPLKLSLVWLEFVNDVRLERRYRRVARRSDTTRAACFTMAYLTLAVYVAHVFLGCTESERNRLVLGVMGMLIGMHIAYLTKFGTAHRFNVAVMLAHYSAVALLALLGILADCNTHVGQKAATANVVLLFFLMGEIAIQFLLEVPLKIRISLCYAMPAALCGLVAIRRAVIRDEVLEWDFIYGLIPVCIFCVSYFADFSQRRAFRGRMSLRRLLKSEAGRHAEFASRAMDVTLPRFVSERIVARLKAANAEGHDGGSSLGSGSGSDQLTVASGHTSASDSAAAADTTAGGATGNNVGDAKAGLLKVSAELVWDFPHVAVMFISFGDVADPVARLHELICTVEDAVGDLGVHKIKTIGTTVLCATGMRGADGASGTRKHRKLLQRQQTQEGSGGGASTGSPEEAVWSSVEAALAVAARLGPDNAAAMRCGIHIGHLVGAVVGAEGLMFDVFGDTVNTASRICTSCPPGSVRLSEPAALRLALLRDLDFAVAEEPTTVQVKGKGELLVYDAQRLTAPNALPRSPSPTAGCPPDEPFRFAPARIGDEAPTDPDAADRGPSTTAAMMRPRRVSIHSRALTTEEREAVARRHSSEDAA